MRITVTIKDDLLSKAKEFSGVSKNPELIRRAILFIIAREKAARYSEQTGNLHDMTDMVTKLYDDVVDK